MRSVIATIALVLLLPAVAAADHSIGAFHADCGFSHRLSDDPIVFPGQPGASHSHDFFGSADTNANSTAESIRNAHTSCVRTDSVNPLTDVSAYWVPTLYDGGPVAASSLGAYYTTGFRDASAIKPHDQGLRIIAGTATGGPSEVDGERVWRYECAANTLMPGTATTMPLCSTRALDLTIRFPDCSDGRLDSPDHKSHMAYSRRVTASNQRTCPSSHPTLTPKLQLTLRYPVDGGSNAYLASGGANTAHADFFEGWNRPAFTSLVNDCLVADRYCGGGDSPDS